MRAAAAIFILAFLPAVPAGAKESAPSAHAAVAEALAAMDSARDLRSAARLRLEVNVVTRDIVENEHSGEPYPVGTSNAVYTDDFGRFDRVAETLSRDRASVSLREISQGIADQFDRIANGKPVRARMTLAPPGWELRDPFLALRLADAAPDLKVVPDTILHARRQIVVAFSLRGSRARLLIDAETHLITAAEGLFACGHATSSEVACGTFGDLVERTEFMIWDAADGLRYPTQWDIYRNGVHLQTIIVSGPPRLDPPRPTDAEIAAETSAAAARLEASDADSIPLGRALYEAPDPHRGIEEIAPGIVQIPGSWYVTLVRQDDGIVVIDAPISSGYSAEAIREAARRFPGLPIKALITSTAFSWHIAGAREYAARHIPIYVLDGNAPVLRKLLAAPRRLRPDRLARKPVRPILRIVTGRIQVGHGRNAILVMPIALAAEPMLMTYIPDAHLLHTGEMIQPLGPGGSLINPESLFEIRQTIAREGLHPERLIGMHMSPLPRAELDAAVRRAGFPDGG
ncbi:MAG TPA: hypothetical protein VGF77_13390 [Allosphingosinicella sp.]